MVVEYVNIYSDIFLENILGNHVSSIYFEKPSGNSALFDTINNHHDSFIKFVISEYGLENYVAYMCVLAYRKQPTLERLVAFWDVFLEPKSKMEINVANTSRKTLEVDILSRKNSIVFTLKSAPPKDTLDKIFSDVGMNLSDTYSRYLYAASPSARNNKIFGHRVFGSYTQKYLDVKKINVKQAMAEKSLELYKLEKAGFPVSKMF